MILRRNAVTTSSEQKCYLATPSTLRAYPALFNRFKTNLNLKKICDCLTPRIRHNIKISCGTRGAGGVSRRRDTRPSGRHAVDTRPALHIRGQTNDTWANKRDADRSHCRGATFKFFCMLSILLVRAELVGPPFRRLRCPAESWAHNACQREIPVARYSVCRGAPQVSTRFEFSITPTEPRVANQKLKKEKKMDTRKGPTALYRPTTGLAAGGLPCNS
ncbi:unnamed protein product, partial [Nesidiocoris tenuis]